MACDGVVGSSKKKSKQACDRCKLQRSKCVRTDMDCKSCLVAKTACKFTIIPKKRGPQKRGMMQIIASKKNSASQPELDPFVYYTKDYILNTSQSKADVDKTPTNVQLSIGTHQDQSARKHIFCENDDSLKNTTMDSTKSRSNPLKYILENIKSLLEWQVGLSLDRTTRDLVRTMFWRLEEHLVSHKLATKLLTYLESPIDKATIVVLYAMAALGSILLESGPLKPNGAPYIFHTNYTQHVNPSVIYSNAVQVFQSLKKSQSDLCFIDTQKMKLAGGLLRQTYSRLKSRCPEKGLN